MAGPARRASRATVLVPLAIALVGLFLRVWAPGPTTETVDERLWLLRSKVFDTAVSHRDFDHATAFGAVPHISAPTMPGVTTMWAGTIGRHAVAWGHGLGLNQDPVRPVDGSAQVLRASRALVALWCSIALGLLIWLAARLVGRRAAWTAGVLLMVEPWLVGNSGVLHTDAMVTMFGAVSLVALAVALQPPPAPDPAAGTTRAGRPRRSVRQRSLDVDVFALVLSGVFGGLALLTKLNAFALLGPGLAVVALADAWSRTRRGAEGPARVGGRLISVGLVWMALAALVFVVLWPAMWTSPFAQVSDMRTSLRQLDSSHSQFFRGRNLDDPGATFYPVALWFRLSPWFLLASLATAAAIVARAVARLAKATRLAERLPQVPWWIVLATIPYFVVISTTAKKLDRYVLPTLPFVALAIGVVLAAVVDAAPRRFTGRWTAVVAVAVTAVLTFSTAALAPYAVSYIDPLVGGQRVAQHEILLGWGEGTSALGAVIAKREAGHCDRIRVADPLQLRVSIQCGRIVGFSPDHVDQVDYAVFHINLDQRGTVDAFDAAVRAHGRLIAETRIQGVVYEQLWFVPHAS